MRIGEDHPLRSHAIDLWRGDLAAIGIQAMHIAIAEIVAEDIDDVGMLRGGIRRRDRGLRSENEDGEKKTQGFHDFMPLTVLRP